MLLKKSSIEKFAIDRVGFGAIPHIILLAMTAIVAVVRCNLSWYNTIII